MKRREVVPPAGQDELTLPVELTEASGGSSAADFSAFLGAQRAWLKDRGVDTTDHRRILAIIRASKAHHGIPDARQRHRERLAAQEG